MKELVLTLDLKHLDALGPVRCFAGLRAAADDAIIWLRGISTREQLPLQLRQLPAVHTYLLDEQGRLFPSRGKTPVRLLPELTWLPLTEFIPVSLPVSAMPAALPDKHTLRLRPSGLIQESQALLTDLAIWKAYAAEAPLIRLKPLRFAVSAANKVLILGAPLPPIPGKEYVMQDHILLPLGFEFDPPVVMRLAARQLNLLEDSILLFDETAAWEQIPSDYFVPATRSAARLTRESKDYE